MDKCSNQVIGEALEEMSQEWVRLGTLLHRLLVQSEHASKLGIVSEDISYPDHGRRELSQVQQSERGLV